MGKFWFQIGCAAALLSAGCTARHYRESATREAAEVIAEASQAVPNMDPSFTIEARPRILPETLPVFAEEQDYFGENAGAEAGAPVLSLEQALGIASSPKNFSRSIRANRTFCSAALMSVLF